MVLCLCASAFIHYAVSPWALLPTSGFDIKDQEGELAIPVDLINEAPPEPPPPPPPVAVEPPKPAGDTPGIGTHADAGPPKKRDAGRPLATEHDAEADAESDAEDTDGAIADAGADGEGDAMSDAESDADASDGATSLSDAMIAANAEAGASGSGQRDPTSLLGGAASGVVAGVQNITVILNMAVIKSNPIGARLGPLLVAMPQWRDFFASTGIDPVRDGDWFMLFGPSLANTERDVAVIHFNVSDARAAKAIEQLARRDTGGGTFDAGVPGVKAWRGRADRAARVFMLPRPHLAVVSPPDFASKSAAAFARSGLTPRLAPGEAVRGKFSNPHGSVGDVPEAITELRIWATPSADGGAEVFVEGDCPDATSASEASAILRRFVRGKNSLIVQAVTHGVLNSAEFHGEGRVVRGHLTVTAEQLQTLYELGAGYMNVPIDPPFPPTPGR